MRERFVGVIENGQLRLDQPHRWRGLLAHHEGKRVFLTLERETKGRSLQANRYLWGVVYATIAAWSGHKDDEIHEAMKEKFLPKREMLMPTGEELPAGGSTRVLNSEEFSEYVSRVKLWAAECGLRIPEPDEVDVTL